MVRQTTNMYSAVKILHFHLACIKNTHISTSLPTSHTSNTWLRISDRPLITSRTSGKKNPARDILVIFFSSSVCLSMMGADRTGTAALARRGRTPPSLHSVVPSHYFQTPSLDCLKFTPGTAFGLVSKTRRALKV